MNLVRLIVFVTLILPGLSVAAEVTLKDRIDLAFTEILHTRMGKAICANILGAQPEAIAFHLGVSAQRAKEIASDCMGSQGSPWIVETSYLDIQKLTLVPYKGRRYFVDTAPTSVPIESWTDPFTNATILFSKEGGLAYPRLVQLLAHEMAVYFDSKANPAHRDAQNLLAMRNLKLSPALGMDPLIALTDPLVAHTLTFVRALQVEFAIVDELVANGRIDAPKDNGDAYLRYLISPQCQQECLMDLVARMHETYLPIGLPLLAYAPHFRSLLAGEILHLGPNWSTPQWALYQRSVNQYPADYLSLENSAGRGPLAGVRRMFDSGQQAAPDFQAVTDFERDDLWVLEKPVLIGTKTESGETLLEFMKRPLLSGYNIMLSSGPRVRVRTGNVE